MMVGCMTWDLGVPLPPLYMRGAGLQGRFPSRLRDEDISTTDITIPPILIQGPITRSRAHQLKQQVNSFLCSSSCENENRLLPNDVLVLRNLGEDQQGLGKGRGVEEEQLGRPHRAGAQAQLDFNSTSESRSRPHQN